MPRQTTGSAFPFFGATDAAGPRAAIPIEFGFWARITGSDGAGKYAWTALDMRPFPTLWDVMLSDSVEIAPSKVLLLSSGTTTVNWAVEANGAVDVGIGTVVFMVRGFFQSDSQQDFRFVCGCPTQPYTLVEMFRDAVPENHADFIAGNNAYALNRGAGDWAIDVDRTLTITALDRLPLRAGDRFWVIRHESGKLVPTYEVRTDGIEILDEPRRDDGLYPAKTLVFSENLVEDSLGTDCLAFDSNGLGLDPGRYAGCDLIGHRDQMCVYRVTCCVPFTPGSHSSSSSESESSTSLESVSSCACTPDACGNYAAGTLSWFWELRTRVAGADQPTNPCHPFSGAFILRYVGSCTWQTEETTDLRLQGGRLGPTWKVQRIGSAWHAFAAGTDVGAIGFDSGANTQIAFHLNGWVYGERGGCDMISRTILVDPLCACPESSSSGSSSSASASSGLCPPICSHCQATVCDFSVNLAGFGSQFGCPASCQTTPGTWTVDVDTFGGCLAALNGLWIVPYDSSCEWTFTDVNGTSLSIHTSGTNQITASWIGGAPLFPQAGYTGTIVDGECCGPLVLTRVSAICAGVVGPGDAPDAIEIVPDCIDPPDSPCDLFNVGPKTLHIDSDCVWQYLDSSIAATLTYDGVSWLLTLTNGSQTVVYRAISSDCCGPGTVFALDTADCLAPTTLSIAALTPCDNCCGSTSSAASSSESSHSHGVIPARCEPDCTQCGDVPVPQQWRISISGFANNGGFCTDCTDLNGEFILSRVGPCLWQSDEFPFCESTTHWAFHRNNADDGWIVDGPADFSFTFYDVDGTFDCCGTNTYAVTDLSSQLTCSNVGATLAFIEPVGSGACEGICTTCGTDPIPEDLFALPNAGDACVDDGPAIALMYDAGLGEWRGVGLFGTCGHIINVFAKCESGTWRIAAEFPDHCDTSFPDGVFFDSGSGTLPATATLGPIDSNLCGNGDGMTAFNILIST